MPKSRQRKKNRGPTPPRSRHPDTILIGKRQELYSIPYFQKYGFEDAYGEILDMIMEVSLSAGLTIEVAALWEHITQENPECCNREELDAGLRALAQRGVIEWQPGAQNLVLPETEVPIEVR